MEKALQTLISVSNLLLKKLAGSAGCDYWADTNVHLARRGKISSLIVLEDDTQIDTITEVQEGVEVVYATTTKSYLNVTLGQNTLIVFDNPVSSITLDAGSVMVYYIDI